MPPLVGAGPLVDAAYVQDGTRSCQRVSFINSSLERISQNSLFPGKLCCRITGPMPALTQTIPEICAADGCWSQPQAERLVI